MKKIASVSIAMIACLCMCQYSEKKSPSQHNISFITVSPDIRLEVLDWGGKGPPLLFLAGLGNSAHVFDDFAPQFTDSYHVLGLTRRGFGASSKPISGYDGKTLALDILKLIDSLKIDRITLIGHSVAGEELTKFAAVYPMRINKLIYLDAAYDRTIIMSFFDKAPPFPKMTAEDSTSLKKVQSYMTKIFGVTINDSDFKATCVFDKNGRYIGDITPDFVYTSMHSATEKPDYKSVRAPALAFYSIPDTVNDLFNFYNELDSSSQSDARYVFHEDHLFQRRQIDLFTNEVASGYVKEIHHSNHYLFISNPKEVSENIREFLEKNDNGLIITKPFNKYEK